jgi:hypothetical protein
MASVNLLFEATSMDELAFALEQSIAQPISKNAFVEVFGSVSVEDDECLQLSHRCRTVLRRTDQQKQASSGNERQQPGGQKRGAIRKPIDRDPHGESEGCTDKTCG